MSRSKSQTSTSADPHLYVYAAVAGRPAARTVAALPALPDGGPPRVLPLDSGVALIVADVSPDVYNARSLETRLSDLDWVSRCGAAHHAVADALADRQVVLPFRLFTIFSTETRALTTLHETRARIAAALERVKGCKEWVLRIGRPDPTRAEPTPSTSRGSRPAERASGTGFLRAKADARHASAERTRRTAAAAAVLFETLKAQAADARSRPAEAGTNLLLDAAFLVSSRQAARFKALLKREAAGLLRDGCKVSLTGPWPPYSFASIE